MGSEQSKVTKQEVDLNNCTSTRVFNILIKTIDVPQHLFDCVAHFTPDMETYVKTYANKYDINLTNPQGHTLLHFACVQPMIEPVLVRTLIKLGVNINTVDNIGCCALHLAIINEKAGSTINALLRLTETVRLLLMNGADTNIQDKQKAIALHYELSNGAPLLERVKLFVDFGSDINITNKLNQTCCHVAASHCAHALPLLMKHVIDTTQFDMQDDKGCTMLHKLISNKTDDVFNTIKLLLNYKPNVNIRDVKGETPLMKAVLTFRDNVNDVINLLAALLDAGANIDDQDNNENTALMLAIKNYGPHTKDIISYLICRGADPNIPSYDRIYVLHKAVCNARKPGGLEIIDVLLKNGADPDCKTAFDSTPLSLACQYSNTTSTLDVVKSLLKAGAKTTLVDRNGNISLYYACISSGITSCEDTVKLLLDNMNDKTKVLLITKALHLTCDKLSTSTPGTIKLLLDAGADTNMLIDDKTVIQVLIENNYVSLTDRAQVLKLLIEAKVDLDVKLHYIIQEWFNKLDLSCVKEIIDLLCLHNYDLNIEDDQGRKVIHVMVESGVSLECVKLLMHCGYDINTRDDAMGTVMHYVTKCDTAMELIEVGADPCAQDANGCSMLHRLLLNDLNRVIGLSFDDTSDNKLELFKHVINTYPDTIYQICKGNFLNFHEPEDHNLLHCAVILRNKKVVKYLLATDININHVTSSGNNALHLACVNCGNVNYNVVDMMNDLIDAGIDATFKNNKGETPLHYYVIQNTSNIDLCVIDLLYVSADNINSRDKLDNSVFKSLISKLAFNNNNKVAFIEVVMHLVDRGGIIDVSCLHELLESNHIVWLDSNGIDSVSMKKYDKPNYDRYMKQVATLLKFTFEHCGNSKSISIMNDKGDTLLHTIIKTLNILVSRIKKLEELCDNVLNYSKADVAFNEGVRRRAYIDIDNHSTLVYCKIIKLIRLLINAGANVNAKNKSGDTPLHLLCDNSINAHTKEIIKLLINAGANLTLVDSNNYTLVHKLMSYDNVNLMKCLATFIDLNAKTNKGVTALHMAIHCDKYDNMAWLLQNGAKLHVRDNSLASSLELLFFKRVVSKSQREELDDAKDVFTDWVITNLINKGVDISDQLTIDEMKLWISGDLLHVISKYSLNKMECSICCGHVNVLSCKFKHIMCLKCLCEIGTYTCEMCRTDL